MTIREKKPTNQPDLRRSPWGLVLEYARCWVVIQQEFTGITVREVLAAIRAYRYGGWQSLDQHMTDILPIDESRGFRTSELTG